MTHRTPEQVREAYVDEFGLEAGETVHLLTQSVYNLHLEWRVFLYFFGGPKERVQQLNEASGSTARIIQHALWDSALLRIRRLSDPASTRGGRNLSLQRLVDIASTQKGFDLHSAWERATASAKSCRTYADKYLAHHDFTHARQLSSKSITRKQTTDAVRAIGDFLHEFQAKVRDTHLVLLPVMSANDHRHFMRTILLGNIKRQELEDKRIADIRSVGSFNLHDSTWPDWIHDDVDELDPLAE